ncbi:hypothetical protein HELRODRAFT_168231 [Helobdella robusta]|uniref:Uncharacterized protein n=1 Tax=Helobdella robusta TaxID=6412 RepID=T1F0C3_HELRO|nr:hypothetical protein HELRODRAFT_168231 [Helobdella robusta]ESO09270.1 hypothetical protein HELRODRAFT_168231 [Helobdella robusta]
MVCSWKDLYDNDSSILMQTKEKLILSYELKSKCEDLLSNIVEYNSWKKVYTVHAILLFHLKIVASCSNATSEIINAEDFISLISYIKATEYGSKELSNVVIYLKHYSGHKPYRITIVPLFDHFHLVLLNKMEYTKEYMEFLKLSYYLHNLTIPVDSQNSLENRYKNLTAVKIHLKRIVDLMGKVEGLPNNACTSQTFRTLFSYVNQSSFINELNRSAWSVRTENTISNAVDKCSTICKIFIDVSSNSLLSKEHLNVLKFFIYEAVSNDSTLKLLNRNVMNSYHWD